MALNISELYNVFNTRNGIQKPTLFNVFMATPPILSQAYSPFAMQDISVLCLNGDIPAPGLDNVPVFRWGYGAKENIPFNAVFDDQEFHFITDAGGFVDNFFRDWMRGIMEYSSEGNIAGFAAQAPNIANPQALPYFFGYRDDYTTLIQISALDISSQIVDVVTLTEAYPINVSSKHYNWGETNQFMITPVTFTYKDLLYNQSTRTDALRIYPSYSLPALEIELAAIEILADTLTFVTY